MSYDALDSTGPGSFLARHIGPDSDEVEQMLDVVDCDSLDQLVDETIPEGILDRSPLGLERAESEHELLAELERLASRNDSYRSFIGMGYYDTNTPPVLKRNILENPKWYTHYTPYQSEIAQGRLEALINFQTMCSDLTGLELANASLLDEGTAAAEAMSMLDSINRGSDADRFLVAADCHPQTIAVVETRAEPVGIEVDVRPVEDFEFDENTFGALLQYPTTDGTIEDYEGVCTRAHDAGARVAVAADLLALTVLRAPGEFGADVAIGSTQRFGVPLGYGGPHAAYLATRETFKRKIPGRLIGVSKDAEGETAYRMALQTREQHIREERATSNICTAQVLLAVIAGMYGCYHGPEGLRSIANRVHRRTRALADGLEELGHRLHHEDFFDTIRVDAEGRARILEAADAANINLRTYDDGSLGVSLDEATTDADLADLLAVFGAKNGRRSAEDLVDDAPAEYDGPFPRKTSYLEHENFHEYRSETEMMRYLDRLAGKDVSLTDSMIPLGSCTMKLNAAAELTPISWSGFSRVHPYAPTEQNEGYHELIDGIEEQIRKMTGLPAVSVQPNSGAQGEYTGLLAIRGFHAERGEPERRVCLIPESAHGTNAASASMAEMEIVSVDCDQYGNVDLADLQARAEEHADRLAGAMFTYPSTHGVFEEDIEALCDAVHQCGGKVYLDGANMNAQLGLCRPGDYGIDICHLNLHKTFAIPHGGGGPGVGPVAATEELEPFLPGHPLADADDRSIGPVASAPWGSASILPISWSYIRLMGDRGLKRASETAILNANYMADRLADDYEILYRGPSGRVAHEFIIDPREFDETAGVDAEDIAKRMIDYGFHAPTMSWPVHGTLMIEPTESESKDELDRFCDAMLEIREEIRAIEQGRYPRDDNPLVNAPHTAESIADADWDHPYSRRVAAFPSDVASRNKFWPPVRRVDNVWGDRNLFCACPGPEFFEKLNET